MRSAIVIADAGAATASTPCWIGVLTNVSICNAAIAASVLGRISGKTAIVIGDAVVTSAPIIGAIRPRPRVPIRNSGATEA